MDCPHLPPVLIPCGPKRLLRHHHSQVLPPPVFVPTGQHLCKSVHSGGREKQVEVHLSTLLSVFKSSYEYRASAIARPPGRKPHLLVGELLVQHGVVKLVRVLIVHTINLRPAKQSRRDFIWVICAASHVVVTLSSKRNFDAQSNMYEFVGVVRGCALKWQVWK